MLHQVSQLFTSTLSFSRPPSLWLIYQKLTGRDAQSNTLKISCLSLVLDDGHAGYSVLLIADMPWLSVSAATVLDISFSHLRHHHSNVYMCTTTPFEGP